MVGSSNLYCVRLLADKPSHLPSGHYDNLTSGDVIFVNASVATSSSNPLTYSALRPVSIRSHQAVDRPLPLRAVNSAGNAILKVDNTTTVPYNEKRNSVRLASKTAFGVGSVWVLDALHTPYGCSTWPAFWSEGTGTWPTTGEIDTFEVRLGCLARRCERPC